MDSFISTNMNKLSMSANPTFFPDIPSDDTETFRRLEITSYETKTSSPETI